MFLTICHFKASGQEQNQTVLKLDEYLKSANNAYRFNGVALVFHNGAVVLNKGYGFSDLNSKTLNNPDTRFPILSITKSFTSTIILKLQDDNKLSINDKLSKYFPDYPNGSKITIHHLLTHSSGIHNYTDDVGIEDSAIVNHPLSKEWVVSYFRDKHADFPPGKRYRYNNSGYFLLGLIIEKVTGKAYETVVRELIFNSLGMTQSGFDFINLPRAVRAQGYEFWDEERVVPYKHYDSTFAYSAGSIFSTTNDMVKWATAVSARRILLPETWELAFKAKIQNYGYGWQTGQFSGRKYVKHSGGYPGFMSEFIYYPEQGLSIILLNNFGTYGQNVWAVGMGISSIMFGLPFDNWKLRHPVSVEPGIMQRHAGRYTNGKTKIEIKFKRDKLYAAIAGLAQIEMYAESDNLYYFKDFNTTWNFSGSTLTIHEHGEDIKLIKEN
jgi:CubicO group peptidase (beta-lactamase class C family)